MWVYSIYPPSLRLIRTLATEIYYYHYYILSKTRTHGNAHTHAQSAMSNIGLGWVKQDYR